MKNRNGGRGIRGLRETLARGFLAVPNFFVDKLMPVVTPHQFIVLLFAWRKTVGYQKQQDWVSLSQFMKGTGLCRDTVLKDLRFWEQVGLLRRSSRRGIRGTRLLAAVTRYDEAEVIAQIERLVGSVDRSVPSNATGRPEPPLPVRGVDTQKTSIKIQSEKKTAATPARTIAGVPFMVADERDRQDNLRRIRETLASRSLPPAERQRLEAALAALQTQGPPPDPPTAASR